MITNKVAKEELDKMKGMFTLCLWGSRPNTSMGPWDKKTVNLVDPDELEVEVPRDLEGVEETIDNLQDLFVNLIENSDMAKILAPTLIAQTKVIDQAVKEYIDSLK